MEEVEYLKDLVVKEDHDDAGDVKGRERRVDDEIGIVKDAKGWISQWCVV